MAELGGVNNVERVKAQKEAERQREIQLKEKQVIHSPISLLFSCESAARSIRAQPKRAKADR